MKTKKIIINSLFTLYSIVLLYIYFIYEKHIIYNSTDVSLIDYIKYATNFIPFSSIFENISRLSNNTINTNIVIENILGNFLIYIPIGLFIPVIFQKLRSLWKTLSLVLLIVIIVQASQVLFRIGYFDVDTIILNLLGSALGYGIWRIKLIQNFLKINKEI